MYNGPQTICFVESGFGKARPWSLDIGSVRIFMGTHSKVNSACMFKPYMDVVWRSISSELFRGASRPHRPFLWVRPPPFFLVPGKEPPLVNAMNFPFILVFPSHSSSTCPFLLVWGGYSSCQSSHQSGWEKLDSMVWGWVCQAMGSTLRRWQPSPLRCSCTEFVLFFRLFCEVLGVKSSSATSLDLQGAFIARS